MARFPKFVKKENDYVILCMLVVVPCFLGVIGRLIMGDGLDWSLLNCACWGLIMGFLAQANKNRKNTN